MHAASLQDRHGVVCLQTGRGCPLRGSNRGHGAVGRTPRSGSEHGRPRRRWRNSRRKGPDDTPALRGAGRSNGGVLEPLLLDQDLCTRDEDDAVLSVRPVQVGVGPEGPDLALAGMELAAALELPELLEAEGPPGLLFATSVKGRRHGANRCTLKPVEDEQVLATGGPIGTREPSQRSLRWGRVRTLGKAIVEGNDPALIVEHARELVGVLEGLDEWYYGPGFMRPVPAVALNDYQVAPTYSLVLPALVRKTGSTADRPGEARFRDVQDSGSRPPPRTLWNSWHGWPRSGPPGSGRSSRRAGRVAATQEAAAGGQGVEPARSRGARSLEHHVYSQAADVWFGGKPRDGSVNPLDRERRMRAVVAGRKYETSVRCAE